jgi:hypothetical protein
MQNAFSAALSPTVCRTMKQMRPYTVGNQPWLGFLHFWRYHRSAEHWHHNTRRYTYKPLNKITAPVSVLLWTGAATYDPYFLCLHRVISCIVGTDPALRSMCGCNGTLTQRSHGPTQTDSIPAWAADNLFNRGQTTSGDLDFGILWGQTIRRHKNLCDEMLPRALGLEGCCEHGTEF